MSLFEELCVYDDGEDRSAALNMALDEALLESASTSVIRFYRWGHAALSFGYFGSFADVAKEASHRELVRRWTGGGIVLHGNDLTYALVIPASNSMFGESPIFIYEKVHRAIQNALISNGARAELVTVGGSADVDAAVNARGYRRQLCFANPVRADVLVRGKKVAGAAQRRTRKGLLQQGSIQHPYLADDFGKDVARILCARIKENELTPDLLSRAQEIAREKYGRREWLERRLL